MAILDDVTLRSICDAAIELRLDRKDLIRGLESRYASGLEIASTERGQFLLDLGSMNEDEILIDGSFPLRQWLERAKYLAGHRRQVAVFEDALHALKAGSSRDARGPRSSPGIESSRTILLVALFVVAALGLAVTGEQLSAMQEHVAPPTLTVSSAAVSSATALSATTAVPHARADTTPPVPSASARATLPEPPRTAASSAGVWMKPHATLPPAGSEPGRVTKGNSIEGKARNE